MNRRLLDILSCPVCKSDFTVTATVTKEEEIEEGELACASGHSYPIKNFVPRLVKSDMYVDNFSFEWKKFSKVQLDVFNGTNESEETFIRDTGFSSDALRGKLILDAGIGAGRFSEVVSRWGGDVVGIDLSYAVDAAYVNIGDRSNVQIIQADIFNLPFKDGIFDYIFSIGVLHHTPDTHEAFNKLVPLIKEGGEIAIWVYAKYFEGVQSISTVLRKITTRMPKKLVYYLSWIAVPLYFIGPLRKVLFPMFQLSLHQNPKWRWLDTFDWYTPKYAWKHTYPEVFGWFKDADLKDITLPENLLSMKGRK